MQRNARHLTLLYLATDVSQKVRSALEFGVVIAVIALLTTLVVRNLDTYLIRSQISEAFLFTPALRAEMTAYRAEYGHWPSDAPALQNWKLSQENDLGKYVDQLILGDGGALTAVFDYEDSAPKLQGRRLTIRPTSVAVDPSAPVSWACGSHRVPDGLTPEGVDETDIDPSLLQSICRDY